MKKSLICILLTLVMLLSFAACGKKPVDKFDEAVLPEKTAPQTPGEKLPAEDKAPAEEETPSVPVPETNPDEGLVADEFVLVSSVDEVLARPHKIIPGSEVITIGYDEPMYLPWTASLSQTLFANIYEGLVYRYMGRAYDVRPLIAESWQVSDDYLTWTFRIRDGVKFTDGTLCDAAAVEKAWDFSYEAYSYTFSKLNISSWEAGEDNSFTVNLSAPCVCFEASIADVYILSPTALAQWGLYDNRAAVGTAPYYVSEYKTEPRDRYAYEPGVEFVIKANPDYYLYERLPSIETIRIKLYESPDDHIPALLGGEADFYTFSSLEYYNTLVENGYEGTVVTLAGAASPLHLNAHKEPAFQIFEVRKAMNRFIDLDEVNNELYSGMGKVQTSIWSVGSKGEVPWPEGFYYDETEGLALLAQAGIAPEDIFLDITKTAYDDYTDAVARQLEKVGIKSEIKVHPPESSTIFDRTATPVFTGGLSYADSVPYNIWRYAFTDELPFIKYVWSYLYDPGLYDEMCGVYEAMMSASSWDEMLEKSKTLTDMYQKDYGALPGVQAPSFVAFSKRLKGVVVVTEQCILLWHYLYL